jgi:hypothetical protein
MRSSPPARAIRRVMRTSCLAVACCCAAALPASSAVEAAAPNPIVSAAMSDGCASAVSGVQSLAKVVSTRDANYHCLGVSVDGSANILGIRFETHEMATTRRQVPRPVRVKEFAPIDVASEHGAVLDGTPGHDAVILQGRIVAGSPVASLVIRFLHNGITGEFQECPIRLDRREDGNWHLVNDHDQDVSTVLVKTWSLPIVGTVGIETLAGICASG